MSGMRPKPPPSLASKLGIGEGRPAFVMGTGDDIALADALEGARCATTAEAGVLLAILATEADLMSVYAVAEQNPQLMLWCVYPKGKGAAYGDTAIRNFLRQRGYVDSWQGAVVGLRDLVMVAGAFAQTWSNGWLVAAISKMCLVSWFDAIPVSCDHKAD